MKSLTPPILPKVPALRSAASQSCELRLQFCWAMCLELQKERLRYSRFPSDHFIEHLKIQGLFKSCLFIGLKYSDLLRGWGWAIQDSDLITSLSRSEVLMVITSLSSEREGSLGGCMTTLKLYFTMIWTGGWLYINYTLLCCGGMGGAKLVVFNPHASSIA